MYELYNKMWIKACLVWVFALFLNNVWGYVQECTTPTNTAGRCTFLSACPFIFYNTGNQEKTIKQIIEEWSCNDQNDDTLVCCPRHFKYKKQIILSEANGTLVTQALYNFNRDTLNVTIIVNEKSPILNKQTIINEEYGSDVQYNLLPQLQPESSNVKPTSNQPSTTSKRLSSERRSATTERPIETATTFDVPLDVFTTEKATTTTQAAFSDSIDFSFFQNPFPPLSPSTQQKENSIVNDKELTPEQNEHPSTTDTTFDIPLDIFTTAKTTTTTQATVSDSIDFNIFKNPFPSASPSIETGQEGNNIVNHKELTPEQEEANLNRTIKEFYRTYTLPSQRVCGLQHSDDYFSSRNETRLDEYPWLALLRFQNVENGENDGFKGAGTLITRRYVLTSAFIANSDDTFNFEVIGVRLGEYNPLSANDCFNDPNLPECTDGALDVAVEETIVHQEYVPSFRINDIALIRLAQNIDFTDYIRPICLPLPGTTFAQPGETVVTSGWGTLESKENDGVFQVINFRKKRSQPILLTNNQCEKQFRLTSGDIDFIITENMFCTQDFGEESLCFRDGGIPVMVMNKLKWHIEGMFIYTSAECEKGAISVHTKVSAYLNWILATIKP